MRPASKPGIAGPFRRPPATGKHAPMLTALRRLAGTWVAKILFVLLILSFAVWGIEDVVRNLGRETAVAHVAGDPIELTEAQANARREMARIARQMGNRFEPDDNIRRAVAAQALEQLISDRALRAEARRLGIGAPTDAVRNSVFAIPGLRGADGTFSRPVFDSFLRQNELNEQQFLQVVAGDLLRQQLAGAVRSGACGPRCAVGAAAGLGHGAPRRRGGGDQHRRHARPRGADRGPAAPLPGEQPGAILLPGIPRGGDRRALARGCRGRDRGARRRPRAGL